MVTASDGKLGGPGNEADLRTAVSRARMTHDCKFPDYSSQCQTDG